MKVKSAAWHYRLLRFWMNRQAFHEMPSNLCTYFWMVVSGLTFWPLIYPTILLVWKWAERKRDDEPGLLVSWLKAKKEKVCPLIEYES